MVMQSVVLSALSSGRLSSTFIAATAVSMVSTAAALSGLLPQEAYSLLYWISCCGSQNWPSKLFYKLKRHNHGTWRHFGFIILMSAVYIYMPCTLCHAHNKQIVMLLHKLAFKQLSVRQIWLSFLFVVFFCAIAKSKKHYCSVFAWLTESVMITVLCNN